MKKNIYLSLDSWYPQVGGPNIVVANYYKYLKENGNDCQIIVPSYGRKKDIQADKTTGLNVMRSSGVYVPFGGFYNATPNRDKKLKQYIADNKPDIFHSHSPFSLSEFFAANGKKYDAPSIVTFHTKFKDEFLRITKSKAITNFMMKRILKAMNHQDYVWTVSNGSAETLREYGYKGDITVIRNGTDMCPPPLQTCNELVDKVNLQYGLTDCENVMLFVGRIVAVKNLQLVFNALKSVKEKDNIPFKFIVVGNGTELHEYQRMVEEFGLQNNVIFTGEILDREFLKGFYLRADLFVFPSVFDTASLCPIEAATFNLPTLLIKDCPTSETVTDNYSGFCEIEDHEAWANRLIEIFRNKAKLKEIGANAKKYVYRSWKDVVDEVEQHYDNILTNKN